MRLVLSFLTRLPVGSVENGRPDPMEAPDYFQALGRRAPLFPLAGLVVGSVAAAADALAGCFFGTGVRSAVAIAASVWVTGALHLDGLMDSADGIGSGRSRERMLEIMRDSRVGAMGVVAGVVSLLLRYALLSALAPGRRWQALLLAPALGRMCIAVAAGTWPAARIGQTSLGASFAAHVGRRQVAGALGLGLGIALLGGALAGSSLAGSARGPIAWLAALTVSWLATRSLATQLGGLTGDTYGAINEVAEVVVLAVFAANLPA